MRKYRLLLLLLLFQSVYAIGQNCSANFTFESDGLTYNFEDLSTSSDGTPVTSWSWSFGDGSTSNQQNPTHSYQAVDRYDVCLTISTQGGCTSTQFCIEVEICELNMNTVVGSCDNNGNIPIDVTISDPFDQAKEIDVFVDNVLLPGSPFDIDDNAPVMLSTEVPGDGLVHTIRAQSLDIGSCMAIDSISVPDCSSNCFLSSMNVSLVTGTTHTVDVGDNFFDPANATIIVGDIVEWNWIGSGHTSTSDANSGPDSWNSGELNAPATYTHQFQTAGTHNYYCIPHGGPGGVGMSGVVISNCPGGSNNLDFEINFSTSVADPAGFNVYIDGNLESGSPYNYSGTGMNTLTIQIPGDGALKTIMIEDVNDPSCTISRDVQTPDCGAAPTCSITLNSAQSGACTNNMVPFDVTVNDINGGSSFTVTVDGTSVPGSPFTYAPSGMTVITIDVPGDGQSHTIEVVDTGDPNCSNSIQVTPPDCSVPCIINNIQISAGQSVVHTVEVADFEFIPQNISITDGDTVEFVWTGAVQHTSTSDASSGPDSWDSGLLGSGATFRTPVLSIGNHPYYCIPHGAPGGVGMSGNISVNPDCNNGMVSALLNFNSSGTGFNGFNVFVDGNPASGNPYSYDPSGMNSVVISMPGDGMSHLVEIRDVDDPTCTGSINYTTTDCNQTAPCELSVSASANGGCNNNQIAVDISVTNLNSSNQFELYLDGSPVPGSPFSYSASGTTNLSIQVPGDGQSHSIEAVDSGDPSCMASTSITTTDCSVPCTITNLQINSGAPIRHVVEVADFEFIPQNISITQGDTVEFLWTGAVQHTSTSDASSGPDSWDSGLLGSGASYIAPILSAGNHPYYCIPHGAPGGVGMSGNISVNPDCVNGMVSTNLQFNSSGTGTNGFNIFIDGQPAPSNPYSYAPSGDNSINLLLPGDGLGHNIEVQDVTDPTCNASINYTTADCSMGANCQLTAVSSLAGPCDNNNDIAIELTVTNLNSGNAFNLYIDGNLSPLSPITYAASGTTTQVISLPGDGQTHTLEIVDGSDPNCSATTSIMLPNCNSGSCSISNLNLSSDEPVKHLIEVQDFSFSPETLNVTVGDTVLFSWTGQVAHTTTSDASSGPDSWDSGLLGQGAEFEIIIQSSGDHPYYCIPHGGPGGVGMAGLITASDNCANGLVNVNVVFESNRTQFDTYNVLIDNTITGNSSYNYSPNGINNVSLSLAGDGQNHQISIQDVQIPSCNAADSITLTQCNGTPCALALAVLNESGCFPNDSFEVQVEITGITQSSGSFNIYINNIKYNDQPYMPTNGSDTTLTLSLLGNGGQKEIEARDVQQSGCSDAKTISAPICGNVCVLHQLQINTETSVIHNVEVKDFEFTPTEKTLVSGDSIQFIWTGNVEHTSTSDANSGPDSWNSGLLGNGATFTVAPAAEGDHPYYCIPHGGPGGIGMSGNLEVMPACDGDSANISISFNAVNAGSGYHIYLDGTQITDTLIPYDDPNGMNSHIFKIYGDGLLHTLTLQDDQTSFCAISTNFTATQCAPPCVIEELSINTQSEIINYVAVRDFDFNPKNINVGTGETIRFVWTGDIPHSTTSDAITGPDSWDSGILGNGAVYDVQIQTPGDHPYYCIPHGGPGGIGMAGNIHADPNCENGQDKIQLEFNVRGGSAAGFNIYIDGSLIPGSPFQYDNRNGTNRKIILLPGDGQLHNITVQDQEVSFCAYTQQVQAQDCNTACLFESLGFNIGVPSYDTVEVADFEFLPKNIQIESGDTIVFDFVGAIAHTVTSDATTGPSVFNSGLLDQGAIYKLSLDQTGQHPYYCIPHGGPGGIGMAGNIEVVNECQDDSLAVRVDFEVTGPSTAYNVYVNGMLTAASPIVYQPGSQQSFILRLPAKGELFTLKIEDIQQTTCTITTDLLMPDCNDPCYPYRADFSEMIDATLLEVQFMDRSDFEGNVSYHWSFGDGNTSMDRNPIHNYNRVGTYEVCLTITANDSSCTDVYCKEIVVGKIACDGDFQIEQDGLMLELTAAAQTNSPQTEYLWDLGDGTNANGKNIEHTYQDLGTYEICLQILYDTCEVNICKTVDLTDSCLLLRSDFRAEVQGDDRTVIFNNLSSGEYTYRLWGFGDGNTSTDENPTHTYSKEGIYNVCLVLRNERNGCSDYYCFEIEVGNVSSDDRITNNQWILYPNPAGHSQSILYLQRNRSEGINTLKSIEIVDVRGYQVLVESFHNSGNMGIAEIQLNNRLTPGLYFVRVFDASGMEIHKLIVQ